MEAGLDLLHRVIELVKGKQALVGPFVEQAGERVVDLPARHLQPQVLSGDGLQVLRSTTSTAITSATTMIKQLLIL